MNGLHSEYLTEICCRNRFISIKIDFFRRIKAQKHRFNQFNHFSFRSLEKCLNFDSFQRNNCDGLVNIGKMDVFDLKKRFFVCQTAGQPGAKVLINCFESSCNARFDAEKKLQKFIAPQKLWPKNNFYTFLYTSLLV